MPLFLLTMVIYPLRELSYLVHICMRIIYINLYESVIKQGGVKYFYKFKNIFVHCRPKHSFAGNLLAPFFVSQLWVLISFFRRRWHQSRIIGTAKLSFPCPISFFISPLFLPKFQYFQYFRAYNFVPPQQLELGGSTHWSDWRTILAITTPV